MGHYVSVQHEFLLLCVRGSCTPDISQLLPSVVTEKRSTHSAKPERFRQMIDEMYPVGRAGEERRSAGRQDAVVPGTHGSQGGPHEDRLVHRPATALRPHPVYLELCGPIGAARVRRLSQHAGAIREPLLITTNGTILDGHVRWRVAMEQHQRRLPCIEYDLTEEGALHFLLARHHSSEGFNAFCRIVVALRLEPYYREPIARWRSVNRTKAHASNLTNLDHVDVRAEIARVADVSTGNVTKVKQLLETVIPEIREQLRRGEVKIHRAWQWGHLSAKQQREALWKHQHRGDIRQTIRRLIAQHTRSRSVVPTVDQLSAVLGGLATHETAVVVADIPVNAIVVTRECYEDLLRRRANEPHGRPTA